jgi:transmembrane sensor
MTFFFLYVIKTNKENTVLEERYLLIASYLAKQTTEKENEDLEDWIKRSPANARTFEEIKNVWQASYQRDDTAAIHAFQRLDQKIQAGKLRPEETNHSLRSSSRRINAYAVMMSLTVFFVLGGFAYQFYEHAPSVFLRAYTTAGQKKQILLEDGTRVFLAPQSELRYPKHFAADRRVVDLQGQAYFEVSKNPHQAFVVHTDALDVQVLGTHFNVNSYKKNTVAVVSLLEGKVKVTMADDDNDEYLLAPGQELSLNRINHQVYQHEFDQKSTIGWMTNILLIKNEKLGQVAEKINKLYGVKIVFADQATADTRLYAEFKDESLLTVLETIKATGNIEYHIEKDKVYLTLKN